jgi:hypothetical protein
MNNHIIFENMMAEGVVFDVNARLEHLKKVTDTLSTF